MPRRGAAVGLLLLCVGAGPAFAQDATAAPPDVPPQNVDGPTISMLIRATLVALDQANITGNYTVLRDLGAAAMQASNSSADLAAFFADFRKNHVALSGAVLVDAILDKPPALTTDGTLHLIGHLPTRPQEILFDLTFFFERGGWRVASMQVGTRISGQDTAAPAPSSASKPAPPTPRVRPKP